MLRLNASVHSWLTRQEMKMAKAQKLAAEQSASVFETVTTKVTTITDNTGDLSTAAVDTIMNSNASAATTKSTVSATEINTQYDSTFVDQELHKQLKNEVGEMYCAWDEADQR